MKPPSAHLLRTLAPVSVNSRILDLGCGHGNQTQALVRLGFEVFACDAERKAVHAARHRIAELRGDADLDRRIRRCMLDAIDFPDASFDWVVAHQPAAYVDSQDDLAQLLAEARRLLKPGAWVFVAVRDRVVPTPEALAAAAQASNLAEAETPVAVAEHGEPLVRGIYRRVEARTPA